MEYSAATYAAIRTALDEKIEELIRMQRHVRELALVADLPVHLSRAIHIANRERTRAEISRILVSVGWLREQTIVGESNDPDPARFGWHYSDSDDPTLRTLTLRIRAGEDDSHVREALAHLMREGLIGYDMDNVLSTEHGPVRAYDEHHRPINKFSFLAPLSYPSIP